MELTGTYHNKKYNYDVKYVRNTTKSRKSGIKDLILMKIIGNCLFDDFEIDETSPRDNFGTYLFVYIKFKRTGLKATFNYNTMQNDVVNIRFLEKPKKSTIVLFRRTQRPYDIYDYPHCEFLREKRNGDHLTSVETIGCIPGHEILDKFKTRVVERMRNEGYLTR